MDRAKFISGEKIPEIEYQDRVPEDVLDALETINDFTESEGRPMVNGGADIMVRPSQTDQDRADALAQALGYNPSNNNVPFVQAMPPDEVPYTGPEPYMSGGNPILLGQAETIPEDPIDEALNDEEGFRAIEALDDRSPNSAEQVEALWNQAMTRCIGNEEISEVDRRNRIRMLLDQISNEDQRWARGHLDNLLPTPAQDHQSYLDRVRLAGGD